MTDFPIPPGLVLIIAGLLLPLLPSLARMTLMLTAPLVTLAMVFWISSTDGLHVAFLGQELALIKADPLSRVFGVVFSLAAFTGALFALNQRRVVELSAAFIYAGGALGVVFAGDLITVFIFWELMAVASTVVIWAGGAGGRGAGLRYAAIHFFGGVLLMAGSPARSPRPAPPRSIA